MKRKYGVMIATWILWFISVLVPLFCMVLQRVPQRFLTIQFLVILLLGILLCVQWIWLRRAERIQNTAVRGEIEGAGMAALQSMTVPMILAERDGKILWSNAIFQNRFVSGRSVLGRSVQDVIHLNLAALDQNRDLLMEHNGLSYRAGCTKEHSVRARRRCNHIKPFVRGDAFGAKLLSDSFTVDGGSLPHHVYADVLRSYRTAL